MVQLGESVQVSMQSAIKIMFMSLPTVRISIISILTKLSHQVFRVSDFSRLPHMNVEGRAVEEKEQRLSISCEFDILGWNRFFAIVKMIYLMSKSSYFSSVLIKVTVWQGDLALPSTASENIRLPKFPDFIFWRCTICTNTQFVQKRSQGIVAE